MTYKQYLNASDFYRVNACNIHVIFLFIGDDSVHQVVMMKSVVNKQLHEQNNNKFVSFNLKTE